jgi:hypothetical protein
LRIEKNFRLGAVKFTVIGSEVELSENIRAGSEERA